MLKRINKSIIVIVALQTLAFCQEEAKNDGKKVLLYENGTWLNTDIISLQNNKVSNILNLEIPKTNSIDKKVTHTGYSLLYNEIHEQAYWVANELTKEETTKLYERKNKFILDPKVNTITASDINLKIRDMIKVV